MPDLVNIFLNDPGTPGAPLVQVEPPRSKSPFAIPQWNGTGGLFQPGSAEFQACQLYVVLTRTYAMWTDFFTRDVTWQTTAAHLPVVPRAREEFNAYYDRQALKFCYATDPLTRQTVYTCESSDVIAHECGHAILDALHPEYWDSLLSESAAFHEAFSDFSALLAALDSPRVRALMLAENSGDLSKSNLVTRLAEQMARGLFNAGYTYAVVSPDAVRDLANPFRYRNPMHLPARAPAARLSSESHNFSRIFSGALYDVLVGIYERLRRDNIAPDDALAQARDITGRLVAHGVLLAPKGDALFKTMATALLTASAQEERGKYFPIVKKALVARRLLKGREADQLSPGQGVLHTRTNALEGVLSVAVTRCPKWEMPVWRIGEDVPALVRQRIPIPKMEFRLVTEHTWHDQTRVLYYIAPHLVRLAGESLGVANGAVVRLFNAVTIQINADGVIVSSHHHQADRAQARRVRDHIAKLIARQRVYAPAPDAVVDVRELLAQRKPYYVAYDEQGNKQIQRAFIACGTVEA
jgi:hypothetical protein